VSLNESIVEDAALEWPCLRAGTHRQIGDPPAPRLRRTGLGYEVGQGPQLAPPACRDDDGASRGEPVAEPACALHADRRDSFGEVVLVGRLREAIRRLNPPLSWRVNSARFPNPF
jgi:hypothetical protein